MNLLDLQQSQYILIEKVKYKVLNMVKFTEKSSYWIEYKLQNIEDNQIYYLNVELSLLATLYKVLNEKNIQIGLNLTFNGEEYEIFEKGVGKIETYYGLTDVGLKDIVDYYEYKCKTDDKKILSIEKWKDEIEVSIGKVIKSSKIKILKEFEQ